MSATGLFTAALGAAVLLAGCQAGPPAGPTGSDAAATAAGAPVGEASAVLYVKGLGCPGCAYQVEKQLLKIPGARGVEIDMGTGKFVLYGEPGSLPPDDRALEEAVDRSGFTLDRLERP